MNKMVGFAAAMAAGATWICVPSGAQACGGFFCSGNGSGVIPVVQAAERVIFEQDDDTMRTYVQIRYDQQGGPPVGFSWIVPVRAVPEVGTAPAQMFNDLDQATAPVWNLINPPNFSGGGGGSSMGCGCASSAADGASFADASAGPEPSVTVWAMSRVGNYETATISGETADDLLTWLTDHEFEIPEEASSMVQTYVDEGHLFVAFRYDPVDQGGTLDPIVLTWTGLEEDTPLPCVPIRITAIASTPILDVMILAFGSKKAEPMRGYTTVEPDYDAVTFDRSTGAVSYTNDALEDIQGAGGRAFVVEYAAPTATTAFNQSTLEGQALVARHDYVTRFYTRFTPDAMTMDPEFQFVGGPDVTNVHTIDLNFGMTANAASTGALRYAGGPGLILGAMALLAWRARRFG